MASKQEPHIHDYKELGYIREVGTTNPSELLRVDISAVTINRIILIRSCTCSKSQAFNCGDADAMRKLYAELKGK